MKIDDAYYAPVLTKEVTDC